MSRNFTLPNAPQATASASHKDTPVENVLKGGYWNAGKGVEDGPQWVEIDVGRLVNLTKLKLVTEQTPNGHTRHVVTGGDKPGPLHVLETFEGHTTSRQTLETRPLNANVRYIRVTTTASPSWVAWWSIHADYQ